MKGAVKNVSWASSGMLATKLVRTASTLLLARLLAPESFGLIAVAGLVVDLLNRFKEFGFGAAFIQKTYADATEERRAANTAFWTGAAANVVSFLGLFCAAPWVATFFEAPQATNVIRVVSCSLLLEIFGAVPALLLMKRMQFKALAIREIVQGGTYGMVAVALALLGGRVWSLVFGQLAASAVAIAVLWRSTEWRPRWEYQPAFARAFFQFGKYVWLMGLLGSVGDGLDRLIIGRVYGPAQLGLYTMAFTLATVAAVPLGSLISKVAYPYFCALRADPPALRGAVETSLDYIMLVSIPAGLGIAAVAPLLVHVVLTAKWQGAVPVLGIFSLHGIFFVLAVLAVPLLQAVGKPAVPVGLLVGQYALKAAALFVLNGFGIVGIAWAVFGVQAGVSTISLLLVCRFIGVRFGTVAGGFLRAMATAGLMAAGVRGFLTACGPLLSRQPTLSLAVAVALGVALFLAASLVLNRQIMRGLLIMLRQRLRRPRSAAPIPNEISTSPEVLSVEP